MKRDFNLIDTFDYSLPDELIAKKPLSERTDSRLLHCAVADQVIKDRRFKDLVDWFKSGDVLVVNNTKVIPARFFGQKESGGRIEGLLERILDPQTALVHLRSSKSPKPGTMLILEGGYQVEVTGRDEDLFECVIQASASDQTNIAEGNGFPAGAAL